MYPVHKHLRTVNHVLPATSIPTALVALFKTASITPRKQRLSLEIALTLTTTISCTPTQLVVAMAFTTPLLHHTALLLVALTLTTPLLHIRPVSAAQTYDATKSLMDARLSTGYYRTVRRVLAESWTYAMRCGA